MTDLVQKIADAVEPLFWVSEEAEVECRRKLNEAIRAALADAGGAVAGKAPCDCYEVIDGLYTSRCSCQNSGDAASMVLWCDAMNRVAHPAPVAGRVAELEADLNEMRSLSYERYEKASRLEIRIAALEQQLTESREREGRMRVAANKLLLLLPLIDCDDLHHPKHKRHGFGEKCPVEAEYNSARQNLAALAAEKGKNDE